MFVDAAALFIDYSGGNRQLFAVKSVSETDNRSTETQNTIGMSKRPAGFRQTSGGLALTLEVVVQEEPEVRWKALADTQEEFSLTLQMKNGERSQYIPCRVSTVTLSGDEEGEYSETVEIVALNRKPLS